MARNSRDYHDLATEYGVKSPGMQPKDQSQQWKDRVDNVHSQAKRTGSVDPTLVKDASAYANKAPASALAFNDPPPSKPAGADWANDPNVGKN